MTDDLQTLLAGMVKPLEWDGKNGFWRAGDAIGGFYEICEIKGEFYLNRMVSGTGSALVPYPTLEAAKAAAQADYTARIASALNLDAVLALVAAQRDDAKTIDDAADQISAMNAELVRLSNDPAAVYANMQCGAIAKPSWDDVLKLYPNESAALVAAAYDQIQSEVYEMRREAGQQANGVRFQALDDVRDMIRNMGQAPTAALARMLADARADEREKAALVAIRETEAEGQRNIKDQWRAEIGADIAAAIRAMKGEQG